MSDEREVERLHEEITFLKRKLALMTGGGSAGGGTRSQLTRIIERPSRMSQQLSIAALKTSYIAVDGDLKITAMNRRMAQLLGVEKRTASLERQLDEVDQIPWAPGIMATMLYDARKDNCEQTFEVEYDDPDKSGEKKYAKFTAVWSHDTGTIAVEDETRLKTITNTFSMYVSPKIIGKLQKSYGDPLQTERRRISILFADLRGFTGLCNEVEDINTLKRLLNDYFEMSTECIDNHEGTVDKLIGDGIMAFFGAPLVYDDHAVRAILCALDMIDGMLELKTDWEAEGIRALAAGIGISTGEAIVGNIGCKRMLDYTALGPCVNLASRLCSIADGGEILVAEMTAEDVHPNHPALLDRSVRIEKHNTVSVKGFEKPVEVLRVEGKRR